MSKRIIVGLAAVVVCGLGTGSAQAGTLTIGDFETLAPESWGINDPSCQPTGPVEEPVVLIHGTSDNATPWFELVPVLKSRACACGLSTKALMTSRFRTRFPR